MYKSVLQTQYASSLFQPLLWPSSGRCVTTDRYIEILQMFMNHSAGVKY